MAQPERTTESSTIISLGELMQMEQRRLEDEKKREEHKRLAQESALRAARAQRERELDEQKKVAEAARRAREEAEMQQAAALAGKLLGFISAAKVRAEHETIEKARQQEHQRAVELEQAKVDARAGVLRWSVWAVGLGAVLAIGGLVGGYAGYLAPAHDREVAALRSTVGSQSEQLDGLERELAGVRAAKDRSEAERVALAGSLARSRQEAEALRKQLEAMPAGRRPAAPPATVEPAGEQGTPCDRFDPMCNLNGRM